MVMSVSVVLLQRLSHIIAGFRVDINSGARWQPWQPPPLKTVLPEGRRRKEQLLT